MKLLSGSTAYTVGNVTISTIAFATLALLAFPFVALLTCAWAEKRFFQRRRRGQVLREAVVLSDAITDPMRPATWGRTVH